MLSKIFKKNETPVPTTALPRQPAAPSPEVIAAQLADKAAWESKLHTAMGDDAALLAIAKESPLIDVKHAAVEALVSEDALKRAEREFRDHDRRVHRTAKQRYEMLVNRRVAAVSAAKLIETASVLLHETSIPANRLVELDRAWGALDQTLLEDKQTAEYHTLWSKLSSLTRERGELQVQVKRWLADADTAWSHLNAVCSEVADGTRERSAFMEARTKVEAMLAAIPATQVNSQVTIQTTQMDAKSAELQQALHLAAAIDARLALLEELQPPPTAPAVEGAIAEIADSLPADVMNMSTPPKLPSLLSRWRALAPVMDPRIAALLDAQLGQWQTAKSDQRQARVAEAKLHAKEESKAAKQARSDGTAIPGIFESGQQLLFIFFIGIQGIKGKRIKGIENSRLSSLNSGHLSQFGREILK